MPTYEVTLQNPRFNVIDGVKTGISYTLLYKDTDIGQKIRYEHSVTGADFARWPPSEAEFKAFVKTHLDEVIDGETGQTRRESFEADLVALGSAPEIKEIPIDLADWSEVPEREESKDVTIDVKAAKQIEL